MAPATLLETIGGVITTGIFSFTVDKSNVRVGDTITLSWVSRGINSFTIDHQVGVVTGNSITLPIHLTTAEFSGTAVKIVDSEINLTITISALNFSKSVTLTVKPAIYTFFGGVYSTSYSWGSYGNALSNLVRNSGSICTSTSWRTQSGNYGSNIGAVYDGYHFIIPGSSITSTNSITIFLSRLGQALTSVVVSVTSSASTFYASGTHIAGDYIFVVSSIGHVISAPIADTKVWTEVTPSTPALAIGSTFSMIIWNPIQAKLYVAQIIGASPTGDIRIKYSDSNAGGNWQTISTTASLDRLGGGGDVLDDSYNMATKGRFTNNSIVYSTINATTDFLNLTFGYDNLATASGVGGGTNIIINGYQFLMWQRAIATNVYFPYPAATYTGSVSSAEILWPKNNGIGNRRSYLGNNIVVETTVSNTLFGLYYIGNALVMTINSETSITLSSQDLVGGEHMVYVPPSDFYIGYSSSAITSATTSIVVNKSVMWPKSYGHGVSKVPVAGRQLLSFDNQVIGTVSAVSGSASPYTLTITNNSLGSNTISARSSLYLSE